MGIFSWCQKRPALPSDIIPVMEHFGRFEFDPQGSGEDAGDIWREWAETVLPFAEADSNGFLVALAESVLCNLGSTKQRRSILCADRCEVERRRSASCSERVEVAVSLYELYIQIGLAMQVPMYWYDRELEPYFPLPRPKI